MSDRKMIKWQPFNSLMNPNKVINEILHEKEKIEKPVLSNDQLVILEEKICLAYESNIEINIIFYNQGYLKNKTGLIKFIDKVNHKIIFIDKSYIYFDTIIDVNL